jgi:adenine-specific DNA-methyltransferase
MGAMCKVQSTPGHFAQYMPNSNERIKTLQSMSLIDEFYSKCDEYNNIVFSPYDNKSYCTDFHSLLNNNMLNDVDIIYLDSPYTQEQYSRFYHILETIVKYDNPITNYKARYRNNRFMSNFCYKSKVEDEFKIIFKYCIGHKINIIISYSNKSIMPIEDLVSLSKEYFSKVLVKHTSYKHSTQGKGSNGIIEYLIICTY